MTYEEIEVQLKSALERLEVSAQKIVQSRSYTDEVERIRMLEELIKEQLRHENLSASTRQIR